MCLFSFQFFALDTLWPCKRVMAFEIRLQCDSKVIVKPDSFTDTYTLSIAQINLIMHYVNLEPLIRSRWYEDIERNGLVRSFKYNRTAQFTLASGQKSFFLNNCLSFSAMPHHLTLIFVREKVYNGAFKTPYVYKHENVKTIHLFQGGIAHRNNSQMSDMDLTNSDSYCGWFLYNQFCKLMCKGAYPTVTYAEFYSHMFVYTFDLSLMPSHMVEQPPKPLDLITSGSVDIHITFNNALTENYVIELSAYHTGIVAFDASGDIRI